MKIYSELDFASFKPWSGAVDTHKRIVEAGKAEAFEAVLNELYPDGMSETELNDILWFEPNTCYEWVGLRTESEIRKEIEAAQTELEDLETEFRDECEETIEHGNSIRELHGMNELDDEEIKSLKLAIWMNVYEDRANEIKARINDLEEELENI